MFDDLFGDFMGGRGGGGGRGRAARGSDLRYNLRVTLEEAYTGVQKTITVPTAVGCEECSGTGAASGSEPQTCPTCSGMGKVRAQQGFFTVERSCPTCSGTGQIISKPCSGCRGAGNATLGQTYLARRLDQFGGSVAMAAAAYNAGAGRVDQWVARYGDPRAPGVDVIDWIETIPFRETRNYVQRVLEGLQVYRNRIAGRPTPFRVLQDAVSR